MPKELCLKVLSALWAYMVTAVSGSYMEGISVTDHCLIGCPVKLQFAGLINKD